MSPSHCPPYFTPWPISMTQLFSPSHVWSKTYQCFQCGDPTHFKWDCPLYTCQTCDQTAPGHAPKACQGHIFDDGIHGHYDIDGYDDGNLTGEC
jgi:hypothetical protein